MDDYYDDDCKYPDPHEEFERRLERADRDRVMKNASFESMSANLNGDDPHKAFYDSLDKQGYREVYAPDNNNYPIDSKFNTPGFDQSRFDKISSLASNVADLAQRSGNDPDKANRDYMDKFGYRSVIMKK